MLRGRLQGNAWVDSKVLATLDVETGTARIAFDDSHHVYVSTSSGPGVDGVTGAAPLTPEQLSRTPAQDLSNPRGKILRWNDDGTVPTDNPFAKRPTWRSPAIWSYGHRNPQGLEVSLIDRRTSCGQLSMARGEVTNLTGYGAVTTMGGPSSATAAATTGCRSAAKSNMWAWTSPSSTGLLRLPYLHSHRVKEINFPGGGVTS